MTLFIINCLLGIILQLVYKYQYNKEWKKEFGYSDETPVFSIKSIIVIISLGIVVGILNIIFVIFNYFTWTKSESLFKKLEP